MTKSAIKKYTERLGFFGMILHYIGRFMTKTEQQVIGKLTVRFGKVKKNRLVFKNREMMDCTDNPEAFYEYLIDLTVTFMHTTLFKIILHITKCSFLRKRTDSPCLECLPLTKNNRGGFTAEKNGQHT